MKLYKNSDDEKSEQLLLKRAIHALKESTGIDASIIDVEKVHENEIKTDATVEVNLGGGIFRYAVEIKRIDRFETIVQIKNQSNQFQIPRLLVSNKISKQSAEKCRELNVQFIDANGNAFLHAPEYFVFVLGQKSKESDDLNSLRKNGSRSGTATGLRVIFSLLCQPVLMNATYREIAKIAGVSIGNMGWIFDDLNARGISTGNKNNGNYRILEWKRLIDEWVTNYPMKLRPKLNPQRFIATDPNWWKDVDITKYGAQWGGEIAADKLTNNLKPSTVTIYMQSENIRKNITKLVVENKLSSHPNGNIEVLEIFWDFSNSEVLSDTVPPLLVYADLFATIDPRNVEIAHQVYKKIIYDFENTN
jgi:hypothetical protein